MTLAVAIVPGAGHDRPKGPVPGKREPGVVTRFGLLAAHMPSALDRLGTMDAVRITRPRHFLMPLRARSAQVAATR